MIRIHIDPKLRPLLALWRLAFVSWALREIDPLHPDLPGLIVRRAELRSTSRQYVGALLPQCAWRNLNLNRKDIPC